MMYNSFPASYRAPQPNYQYQPEPQYQPQYNQYQAAPAPNRSEIFGVSSDQEVMNHFVQPGQTAMFIDINQMKLYTKDGSNGLVRDFELNETPESLQRCRQMEQMSKAQFPVVDATVQDVSTSPAPEMQNMEHRMDILEQHFEELMQNLNKNQNFQNQKKKYPDKKE